MALIAQPVRGPGHCEEHRSNAYRNESRRGELSLDAPLGFDWLPEVTASETDPRNRITLRHALHMSSGLYPVDSFGMEYATGSGLAYWAGASSTEGMRNRGLIREPEPFGITRITIRYSLFTP